MPRGCALRAALLAGSVFRAGAAAPPWRRVLDHGEVRGFPSYEAANALLDTWVKEQPGVLRRQEIGHSYEQRPIHAYVLAANASESQGRPKVLLTSLMHAREPASLTVVLNFLGRILELYSSGDPEAASVMSARELWLVPFVNPDGYVENERLLAAGVPDSAVLVRKNRRPTCDSSVDGGVDLNRNFGVHWKDAFEPCGEEYQGTEPFSEPETQALKKLCEERGFKAAINFHSFGGMLTHPFNWARVPKLPAEDQAVYGEIAEIFGWEKFGPAVQTVGYTTTGESDDWMYGAHGIISMSPEVGPESGDFWPPSELIEGIDERNFVRIMYVVQKAGLQLYAGSERSPASSAGLPDGASELPGGAPREVVELRLRNGGLSASAGEALGVAVAGLTGLSKAGGGGPAALVRLKGAAAAVPGQLASGGALTFKAPPLPRRSATALEVFVGRDLEPRHSGGIHVCVAEATAVAAGGPGGEQPPVVCQCADAPGTAPEGAPAAPRLAFAGAGDLADNTTRDKVLCALAAASANQSGLEAPSAMEKKAALRANREGFVPVRPRHEVGALLGGCVATVLAVAIVLQVARRRRGLAAGEQLAVALWEQRSCNRHGSDRHGRTSALEPAD